MLIHCCNTFSSRRAVQEAAHPFFKDHANPAEFHGISENAYRPMRDLALWLLQSFIYTGNNRKNGMSALLPFLALDQTCEQVQGWVGQQLTGAGFRIVQTFDLHVARMAHSDCLCPHHGTNNCNCQMIVLLVYQKLDDPVTLVIHGQDDRTWLSLANPTGENSNHHLEMLVRRILSPRESHALLAAEVNYENQSTL
jgi:hypothetical protein